MLISSKTPFRETPRIMFGQPMVQSSCIKFTIIKLLPVCDHMCQFLTYFTFCVWGRRGDQSDGEIALKHNISVSSMSSGTIWGQWAGVLETEIHANHKEKCLCENWSAKTYFTPQSVTSGSQVTEFPWEVGNLLLAKQQLSMSKTHYSHRPVFLNLDCTLETPGSSKKYGCLDPTQKFRFN